MNGILEGIRIIEWGTTIALPDATTLLARLGAEVIKIERKDIGDTYRWMKRMSGVPVVGPSGQNMLFEPVNLFKKSVAIDLSKEKGRQAVYRLAEKADIFATNFRLTAASRTGMSYSILKLHNPRLIYLRVSGYGGRGPARNDGAFDRVIQARSGFTGISGAASATARSRLPASLTDHAGSLCAAFAMVVAIQARERLGVGQELEVSLLGAMSHILKYELDMRLLTGEECHIHDRIRPSNPLHNYYQAVDGKWFWLNMAIAESDKYWARFCHAVGIEEWEKDPRCLAWVETAEITEDLSAELTAAIGRAFAKHTSDEWTEILRQADLLGSRIYTISDAVSDPQMLENKYIVDWDHPVLGKIKMTGMPISFSGIDFSTSGRAPELGEHTEEVLTEIGGLSWDEIEDLRISEAI